MKIIDYYEFTIPEWAVCPIVYGKDNYDSLDKDDIKNLESFLSDIPKNGNWEFGEDSYFSKYNDIDNLGNTCIDTKYIILGESKK